MNVDDLLTALRKELNHINATIQILEREWLLKEGFSFSSQKRRKQPERLLGAAAYLPTPGSRKRYRPKRFRGHSK